MLESINKIYNKLPSFVKNKYILSSLILLTMILFIEPINLFNLINIKYKLNELNIMNQKKQSRINEIDSIKNIIKSNPEKYAREFYMMKRTNEDIFVLEEEK